MNWKRILLPDPEREFPGERAVRTGIRTAHIIAMGALLGGHVFDIEPARLVPWLVLSVATGATFVAVELYGSCAWAVQLRGLLTAVKVGLLLLVPLFWHQRVWILMLIVVIGAVGSHMPSRLRYYSFMTGSAVKHGKKKG